MSQTNPRPPQELFEAIETIKDCGPQAFLSALANHFDTAADEAVEEGDKQAFLQYRAAARKITEARRLFN